MKTSVVYLSKIIYCPLNQKYKVIFSTSDNLSYFFIYFNNIISKQIAMASEGIVSNQHSQNELFLTLLDSLRMKVHNIVISKIKNNLIAEIKIIDSKKDEIQIYGNISDGVIIALKMFSNIHISDDLLVSNTNYRDTEMQLISEDNSKYRNTNKLKENSSMKVLEVALTECIKKENYESAAFLRDRIKELKLND